MLIESCVCGSQEFSKTTYNDIKVNVCNKCGVYHQRVDKTLEEYQTWYTETYHKDVYTHTFLYDVAAAVKRINIYPSVEGKWLDVGSGNNAFVDTARKNGIQAYGLEPQKELSTFNYRGFLETHPFPCDYFSVVTAHDVLEHAVDLNVFLRKAYNTLTSDGTLIIDFPDFWSPDGVKHWKETEHLWMLTLAQLTNLLIKHFFQIDQVITPVPGKKTFFCKKIERTRNKILVPPGIGDSFWAITKIESLIALEGLTLPPEVVIASTREDRNRAFEFVRRFPFLKCSGYLDFAGTEFKRHPLWRQAYHEDGNGVFKDVFGCDWFLSANGPFRFDHDLDSLMKPYKTNWYPEMFISAEEDAVAREQAKKPYIVTFFTSAGPYKNWFKEYPVKAIVKDLKKLSSAGYRVLLTGASWDKEDNVVSELAEEMKTTRNFEDIRGDTTLDVFLGLLRGASGTFGFCGGNTIFSTVIKKPTVILWNDYYNEPFFTTSCPPDSLDYWYKPVNTKNAAGQDVASLLLDMIDG